MPIGYFVTVVRIAVCTALALRPFARPRPLAASSYLAGVFVNELPQLVFVFLLASTLLAFVEDDLTISWLGWICGGLAALVTIGLSLLMVRARHDALKAVSDVRAGLANPHVLNQKVSPRRSMLHTILTPFPARPRDIERVAGVPYGTGGRAHRLDVYRRRRPAPERAAVLIYLHGGGYYSGGKHREGRLLLHRLSRRGWICVSANYRLRPKVGWPEHLLDAKRVIAWVREHAAELSADPARIVIAGSSSGAHMASLAGLTANDPRLQPGFEDSDTTVSGVVGLYGYYGRYYGRGPDEGLPSSPLDLDSSKAPPFFLAHGAQDSFVSVTDARRLAAKLRETSPSTIVYVELAFAQHGFDLFRSLRYDAVVDGIEAFVTSLKAD